jgi:hypothetical protein
MATSFAKKFYNTLTPEERLSLKTISRDFRSTLLAGELRRIEGHWYVTHAGLMRLPFGIVSSEDSNSSNRGNGAVNRAVDTTKSPP